MINILNSNKVLSMEEKNYNKELPNSVELEEYVLGTILSYPDSLSEIHTSFNPKVFYSEDNRRIATNISKVIEKNMSPTIMNVAMEELSSNSNSIKSDVVANLMSIADKCQPEGIYRQYSFITECYLRRELIVKSSNISDKAYDMTLDVFTLISDSATDIKKLDIYSTRGPKKSFSEILNSCKTRAETIATSSASMIYSTGDAKFDYYLGFSPNDITLLSGESGSAKTKFNLIKMFKLLQFNQNISIYWHTFEDDPEDLIDMYVGSKIFASKREIQGKSDSKLSTEQLYKMSMEIEKIKKYDIVFNSKRLSMPDIRRDFITFCNARKDRYCILVVDNVMLLLEQTLKMEQTKIDDLICTEIKSTFDAAREITDVSFVFLHHLNSEYANPKNIKFGYKPTKNNMKGSTRYHDIAKQVWAINMPQLHKDLISQYYGYEEMMEHLYIISSEKNRNGENTVIRYFCDLGYNIFYPINKL